MLTEIYIEALLVDEDLADQVWEALDRGVIDSELAFLAWMLMALRRAKCIPQLDCVCHARTRLKLLLW